jgi:ADP-dependent NAD(P)H-hydrate dehydratase / NAD(P)H-hydrate epimerase
MPFDPIYRVAELRALEASAAGQPLMERAGLAAAGVARELLAGRLARVLVLAGPGNNGGDAFVVARWLKSWFFDVVVAFRGDAARLSADAAVAHRNWHAAGGTTLSGWPDRGEFGLIVDGLFGIGLTRPAEGDYAQWIARANSAGVPILALDVPSGLDADTGVAHAPTIRAAATATFIALKPGMLTADGPDHCGAIGVHALELEVRPLAPARGERVTWTSLRVALPEPLSRARQNVHKGSFGTLAIIGGGDGMVGAAILAGRAALHLGAGKVWVGLAASAPPALDWVQPELMLRAADGVLDDMPDALVIGPGLGAGEHSRKLLRRALSLAIPTVIDADALNLIGSDAKFAAAVATRKASTAITPHPAEAARLSGATTGSIQADRLGAALTLAAKLNAAIVLKGAGSVMAFTDGSWAINASGNAGLASGGTGDVLAGMLGALLAQTVPVKAALECAVCLHGAAADALVASGVGPLGLVASELAPMARRLVNAARG